jgi:glycosyltransferase involved in cell wall biosynthesis
VTVAIATYNGAAFVEAAITSALQTGFEVSVSDDGSTDDTLKILRHYEGRITLHCHPRNLGIAANYQFLLQHCATPLALFLNQDDILHPHRIAGLRLRGDSVTVFNGWVIDEAGQRCRVIYRRPPWNATLYGVYHSLLQTGFFMSPSQSVFPVEAARSLGGFGVPGDPGQGAEDWMCWLRLAAAEVPFVLHLRPSMAYRMHGDNYSHQSDSHLASKTAVRAALPAAPARDHRLRVRW